jgi:toxin FitB
MLENDGLKSDLWFVDTLLPSFRTRILPVNRSITNRWAVISAQLQREGRQIASIDGLIAATAVEHGLMVVSRDVDDFDGFQVPVLNPWPS